MSKVIHYISPSQIPSRTANSIHVIMQCDALGARGDTVFLYYHSGEKKNDKPENSIKEFYGVELSHVKLIPTHSLFNRAINLKIALTAISAILKSDSKPNVLSRNMYASALLSLVLRIRHLYEVHHLESGLRGVLQRIVIGCQLVRILTISDALKNHVVSSFGVDRSRVIVLRDAAPEQLATKASVESNRLPLKALQIDLRKPICGYFGHLYSGRGLELIEGLAAARCEVQFLIFGGNEAEIIARRKANKYSNLKYVGFIPYGSVHSLMKSMDVLLMPYQNDVSIGGKHLSTANWMSPMKMFEYMSTNVPVIASDLPVLREVLFDELNCLLAEAADVDDWLKQLDRLLADRKLAKKISAQALSDFVDSYTWESRAERISKIMDVHND